MNAAQFLHIVYARKWIILGVAFLVVALTVAINLMLPKEYTASATLVIDSKSKDPLTGQLVPSQLLPGYVATQVDVIKSRPVVDKVIDQNKILDAPSVKADFMESGGQGNIRDWLAGLLQSKLEVDPSRESSVITISYKATTPQFAAIMANSFAKAYIQTNLDLRVEPARQMAVWYDQQIEQLRNNLANAQQKLTAYQRENGLVDSEERLDVENRRLTELAGQLVAAQSAGYDSTSRVRESQSLPEVINNPVVQNLKAQLAQREGNLAELGAKVGKNHPDYQRLTAEVESIRTKLQDELKLAIGGVAATASASKQREAGLRTAYEDQRKRLLSMKEQREELSRLAREAENAQRIYDAALQRYVQIRMESQSTLTDIAVLNPATVPAKPSGPKVILNTLIAFLVCLPLAIGVGILVEMVDRRVRTSADLEHALGIPLLAELSKRRFKLRDLLARIPGLRRAAA